MEWVDGVDGVDWLDWPGTFGFDLSVFAFFDLLALGGVVSLVWWVWWLWSSLGTSISPAWLSLWVISAMVAFVFLVALGASWLVSCIRVVGALFFSIQLPVKSMRLISGRGI